MEKEQREKSHVNALKQSLPYSSFCLYKHIVSQNLNDRHIILFCSLRKSLSLTRSSSIKLGTQASGSSGTAPPSPDFKHAQLWHFSVGSGDGENIGSIRWRKGQNGCLACVYSTSQNLFGQMRKRGRHLGMTPSCSTASCRCRAAGFHRKHFATAPTRCPFSHSLTRQS